MPRRRPLALLLTGAVLPGCATSSSTPSPACTAPPAAIEAALAGAPGRVRLADGSSISRCVSAGRSDGDVQNVGTALTTAADTLALRARSSERAAVELGYLIGAAERGAMRGQGIHAELVRRLEQDAILPGAPGARHAELERGRSAGRALG